MPFERYLRQPAEENERAQQTGPSVYYNYGDQRNGSMCDPLSSSFLNSALPFQIPQYMYSTPPLAPGGGAEVLPVGLLASSWMSSYGFQPFGSSLPSSSRPTYQSNVNITSTPDDSSIFHYSYPVASELSNAIPQRSQSDPSFPFAQDIAYPAFPECLPTSETPSLQSPQIAVPKSSGLTAPSSLGLPVYSSSGFDLLSILARVVTRPNPKIFLGPVDGSCSFVVCDIRRYDAPIVYASPTFYALTGYEEHEVIGRNCRFLQAPGGNIQKGEERRYVAPEAVALVKKNLLVDKEVQVSIINYKKDGSPFVNLVTIIPIAGGLFNRPEEADNVIYHVGFQVDLTKQPNAILQKLRDGNYIVNYSSNISIPSLPMITRDRRTTFPAAAVMSKHLRNLISDARFANSIPISKSTTIPPAPSVPSSSTDIYHDSESQLLNLLLLEKSPDFVHVLSLKGTFLYVAPSVRLVLGYEPDELVGKSISDYCHPADLVPLMRELKDSSAPGAAHDAPSPAVTQSAQGLPRTIDLLFRAQSKSDGYVWVECRGRLHAEPGKGRKAIILSGRAKRAPNLRWSTIAKAGGLAPSLIAGGGTRRRQKGNKELEREFWGMLSAKGTFLVAGTGVSDVLGWGSGEMVGKDIGSFIVGEFRPFMEQELVRTSGNEPSVLTCMMSRKDGDRVSVCVVLYWAPSGGSCSSFPVQIRTLDASPTSSPKGGAVVLTPEASVFEELDTSRGSSWQYELQQLRFTNLRLEEEVGALEASSQSLHLPLREPRRRQSNIRAPQQAYVPVSQSYPSLKRSWDAEGLT